MENHSETVQIDYDPAHISYENLLTVFWENHNPQSPPYSRQYMSAVFYHNEDQKRLALHAKQQLETKQARKIYTEILPFTGFYLAEDYHQKFSLQHRKEIMQELKTLFLDMTTLVNSTTAARVNGYLAGHGAFETLQEEFGRLGIPEHTKEELLKRLK